MADAVLPIIDYTSRDYPALRADLIKLVRTRIPGWTGDDNNDFGLALLEAFAYGIDSIHYYLDRVMNEAYLSTAVQRESLYAIADMFHYSPRAPYAATVELTFINSSKTSVTVPSGTICQASVPGSEGAVVKSFETIEQVDVPAADTANPGANENTVIAIEGQTYPNQTIGTSTGYAGQRFTLGHTSVLPGTTSITTTLQEIVTPWTEISDINNALPSDNVFQIQRLTDGSSVVIFGNSLNGMIPELHSTITATYRVGGGTDGNVPAGSVTVVAANPTIPGLAVRNDTAAYGGMNAESLDSIRINAAKSFRAKDRAVTISDYEALAESMDIVTKAKAVGNSGSSVTLYAVSYDDGTGKPVMDEGTKDAIRNEMTLKSMAGVSVTVLDAYWQNIYIVMTVYCSSTAYTEEVEKGVRARLASFYGFETVDFDGRVAASDIAALMTNAYGVDYIEVTNLKIARNGDGSFPGTPSTATLIMNTYGTQTLPYYRDTAGDNTQSVVLTMVGGITAV